MGKTEGSAPRWQREDAQGGEEATDYGGDDPAGRFAASEGEEFDEQYPAFVDLQDHHDSARPSVASRWQKKEYPTTEHAVRTLALHTGTSSHSSAAKGQHHSRALHARALTLCE
jgi:hypothetical protein